MRWNLRSRPPWRPALPQSFRLSSHPPNHLCVMHRRAKPHRTRRGLENVRHDAVLFLDLPRPHQDHATPAALNSTCLAKELPTMGFNSVAPAASPCRVLTMSAVAEAT